MAEATSGRVSVLRGEAQYGLGEYQRSAALHQQTLGIRERVLGAEHPTTLGSRNNLANALAAMSSKQNRKRWWRRNR
ncbi:tetratricopeptide repeat protein [Pseudonocardia sp. Cha107L01]|uniref:tetratricopeptide repeat protein n=1 Tax=Pseudonocardia sp. Cha107L01 TaxID=3457576 RepID=UPI00403E71E9